MKKSWIALLVLGMLFVLPLVNAQTYSGFNRFSDNVKLFFSSENKVQIALDIREKEVNSAIENTFEGNSKKAAENLEKAQNKLQLVQEKVSLENAEEIKNSVDEVKSIIEDENLSNEFSKYISQEEKTQLIAELTKKTYEYCKELANEGYEKMLTEEICNPKTAQKGLEDELRDLKDIQTKQFVQLMLEIRSCVDDPGTCNCEDNLDIKQKSKCEQMVALALKCEYNDEESSCDELKSMEPKKGDSFAESFIPSFLMNLFKEKEYMIGYDINHSCGVPEECWDENDKPECKQYDYLKETKNDWDEYGNYIGKEKDCGMEGVPTMQESIPQCFDENNNFLEEKCGEITMIKNEEGLVNYLIGKEINKVISEFENKSEQHRIDINETDGQTTVTEIKGEMNEIQEQIVERTFAEGTYDTGDFENDIKEVVVEGDKGVSGDDGLTPEVKTEVSGSRGEDNVDSENNVVIDEDNSGSNGGGNSDSNEVDEGSDEPGVVDED